MITPEKCSNAFYALQGILIRARSLALDPEQAITVAELLDYAENLPRLMASQSEETSNFRAILAEVAERYQCAFILQRFDDLIPAVW